MNRSLLSYAFTLPLCLAMALPAAAQISASPGMSHRVVPTLPDDVAKRLCERVFSGALFRYDMIFSVEFRRKIPEATFRDILRSAIEAAGVCVKSNILPVGNPTDPSKAFLTSVKQNKTFINFEFDEEGFVTGLNITDMEFPRPLIRTWGEAANEMARLPGQAAMTAGVLARPVDIRKAGPQPIGSTFKLYVLKTVEDEIYAGRARWTDRYPIREDWKSLPSGVMQDYPAGRQVSIAEFSEAMISISDNTATDHLMRLMSRERVEQTISNSGHSDPGLNVPFLRTDELFKLKWGAPVDWARRYIQMSVEERRTLLDRDLLAVPLASVGRNGVPMNRPTHIREIEWFATTADICKAFQGFTVRRDPTVMKILSKNVPFVDQGAGKKIVYAGYKGGSEAGVISMNYLILDRRGNWGCLSAAWSNETREVNRWIFHDIVRKALKVYEAGL